MPVVDIHTHMYPPSYMALLRARTQVPYVRSFPDDPGAGERLVILPAEDTASTARGRPIGPEYFDVHAKLAFMRAHGIDVSVLSLANPWLDWLPAGEAAAVARAVNDDVEAMCAAHEGKLFAFGTLPLSAPAGEVVQEIARLGSLPHMRGVVMGTSGLGAGLDDPALDPIYAALEAQGQLIVGPLSPGSELVKRLTDSPVPAPALRPPRRRLRAPRHRLRPRAAAGPGFPARDDHRRDAHAAQRRLGPFPGAERAARAQRRHAAAPRRPHRELRRARRAPQERRQAEQPA